MNGSDATFSPTCFIETSARRPTSDTPSASSYAVFSFVHQAAFGFPWVAQYPDEVLRYLGGRSARIGI